MARGTIHVGTSGWHYAHWRGPFYPEDAAPATYLRRYAETFRTVEVNHTFYELPEIADVERWRETVPEEFVFAVKASRYVTHMKKLEDPVEPVGRFLGRVEDLGPKLGPILFQCPPRWHRNADRLRAFLEVLPADHRYVFEFRDPSWWHPEVLSALEEAGIAFCLYDVAGEGPPRTVTADFLYVRFHGAARKYQGRYPRAALAGWAGAIHSWAAAGRDVYAYFNNDPEGHAVENAREFAEMVHA